MNMKRWTAAVTAAILLSVAGQAAATGETGAVKLKGSDRKDDAVYEQQGRLYGTPSILEKGGQWKISENDGRIYAEVEVKGVKEREKVLLSVSEINGKKLIDLSYFAKQAGVQYIWNEKKNELFLRKGKMKDLKFTDKKPFLLMWDPDSAFQKNAPFFSEKAGRRVLSPSWVVADREGMGEHKFPLDYLQAAREIGIEVMPLVNNNFDPAETSLLLKNEKMTKKMAARMAAYALVYDLPGYNVDFENMDPKDKDRFTDFVKELSDVMHKNKKQVSVDVTAIVNNSPFWSGCYDRKALAKEADHIIFMGYDQTPGNSETAGSVASYDWLDGHIKKLLKEIPKEKLVLGLPFYTRVWSGPKDDVTSDVLTQKYTAEFSRQRHLMPKWLDKEKQFFAQWKENGVEKSVWFEEERSLQEKLSLIKKYKLVGAGFWRYEFESSDLYEQMEKSL